MGHIFYVIGSLDVGGTERHLSQIAIAMKRRGWTVTIACLTHKGTLAPEVESAGVEVLSSRIVPTGDRPGIIKRALRMISEAGRLARILAVRRPDIAHFFLPDAYILGGILAGVTGVPIRIMSRRSLNLYQSHRPVARFVEVRLHNRMTAVLINAMPQLHELATIEGCQPQRIGLIYNGVDTTRFRPASDRNKLREAFKLDTNAFIMICVANLIPYKGHVDLFEALARIAAQLPLAWRLLCVGRRGNYAVELESLAERLGISAHIDFLGECANVSFLLQTADIGILSSHEEGMSNVILEAM
ncbi:MAG TPA: glycosyltransferase, partial [Methyloceanibacter sp.]